MSWNRIACSTIVVLSHLVVVAGASFAPTAAGPILFESDGAWSHLPATLPSGRLDAAAAHDPVRDRILVFGGFDGRPRNDLWAIKLGDDPVWKQIPANGTPPPARSGHTAIYDPLRKRIVVFGGDAGGSLLNDIWELSLVGQGRPTWRELQVLGPGPEPMANHSAIYDQATDRMVVFGGGQIGGPTDDVWSLSLADANALSWTQIMTTGTPPLARRDHVAVCDPVARRMLVHGGRALFYSNGSSDLWALPLDGEPRWVELAPVGPIPSGRFGHAGTFDPSAQKLLIFGGLLATDDPYGFRQDTWELDVSRPLAWTQLALVGSRPAARLDHSFVLDPMRGEAWVIAGGNPDYLNEAWALPLDVGAEWRFHAMTWTAPPARRKDAAAIWSPVSGEMIVHGGQWYDAGWNAEFCHFDVWANTFDDPVAWRRITITGPAPYPRAKHSATYDSLRDRMVIFGGWNRDGAGCCNNTWALPLTDPATWEQLAPSGTPPPLGLRDHSAIYDPARDRMIVFGGGFLNESSVVGNLWSLSFTPEMTWSALNPLGTAPPARRDHTAIYDPDNNRMIVYAGRTASAALGDLWALDLEEEEEWVPLAPQGPSPTPRHSHVAVLDPLRRRMIIHGGGTMPDEMWALRLDEPLVWTAMDPEGAGPSPRTDHVAAFDPQGDQIALFSGTGSFFGGERQDTWSAAGFGGPVRFSEGAGGAASALDGGDPRSGRTDSALADPRTELSLETAPSAQHLTIRFGLPAAGQARVDVFDVSGRLVERLRDGFLPAGQHEVTWSESDGAGRRVARGTYFVRLQTTHGNQVVRAIVP